MNYMEFYNTLKVYPAITTRDIEKIYPDFNFMNLANWQKKGYVTKLRNKLYFFNDRKVDEIFLFCIANKMYSPSYISLESALSYYNIIPEGVFAMTSVSTLKTNKFQNNLGYFRYTNIKPELFFGYKIIRTAHFSFNIADTEKTMLDTLYLRSPLKDKADFDSMRFNREILKENLDFKIIDMYLQLFSSKVLEQKVKNLKGYLND